MSAELAWLPEQLQEAVDNQVLSSSEAWSIADLMLLSEEDELHLPKSLEPQLDKLMLWRIPVQYLRPQ
jgi:hypothetical protein